MGNLVKTEPARLRPQGRAGYLVRGPIAPVFVERGALSPEDAIPFQPRDRSGVRAFATLAEAGVLRRVGDGWWLDIVAYQAHADARSRAAVPYLIAGSVAIALAATWFYVGG